jgi:hypothetical protein
MINAYLIDAELIYVEKRPKALFGLVKRVKGNQPTDGGHLILSPQDKDDLLEKHPEASKFIRPFYGSQEFIKGVERYCLWIADEHRGSAEYIPIIKQRLDAVTATREKSDKLRTRELASHPNRFGEIRAPQSKNTFVIPRHSSDNRLYLPVGFLADSGIVSDSAMALYDAQSWNLSLIASRLHLVWIATVCGKIKSDYRYSNTLGWNTFPVPKLTDEDKAELEERAEDILLARADHFPATIAELYDDEKMPEDLREAHRRNDETIERIYIGRNFRNDTERLEHLFKRYTPMVKSEAAAKTNKKTKKNLEKTDA